MGNNALGYTLCGAGFLSLLCSFDKVNVFVVKTLPVLAKFPDLYFQVAGGALIMFGVFLLAGKGKRSRVVSEVPIYHGNDVVGYRRQK